MKKLYILLALTIGFATCAFSADETAAPAAQPANAAAPAPQLPSPEEMEKTIKELKVYKDCYSKCVNKIAANIIMKSEGIACMDLCLTDIFASSQGSVKGRLYIKKMNGAIEKGFKIPITILSLNIEPKDKPADFDANRDALVKLINAPIEKKQAIPCAAPNFKNCGNGMESLLAKFALGSVNTDIDNGAFQIAGIPDGQFVLWVDWFWPSPADPSTGTLYRWLWPIKIADGKAVNVDLTEDNISFILTNFSLGYLNPLTEQK